MNYRFDGRGYLSDPRDSAATPPRELYVVPRDGGSPRRLTGLGVDVQSPGWSPDSRRLAFAADTHQRDEFNYGRADLWTVGLDGPPTRLTDDGYDHGRPVWSTDGTFLIFTREQSLNDVIARKQGHGGAVDLYRMPAAGGAMTNLTPAWDLLPGGTVASPDGQWVYFTSGIGGSTHLWRMSLRAGGIAQVTTGERRLAEFDRDAGFGRLVYTGATSDRPGELFTSRGDGSDERRLTAFNDALVAEVNPLPARRLSSRARTAPRSTVAAAATELRRLTGHSLILAIHGGPHGAYGNDSPPSSRSGGARLRRALTNPRGLHRVRRKVPLGTLAAGACSTSGCDGRVDHALANSGSIPGGWGSPGIPTAGITEWVITRAAIRGGGGGRGISNWISDYARDFRAPRERFLRTPWRRRARTPLEAVPIAPPRTW